MKFIQIAAICMLFNLAQAINECKQYLTCPECLGLNTTAPFGVNPGPNVGRKDCGWCHVPITYEDGHTGARCADVRDDPWNCGDQYDTATCSPGWACDESSGQCIMANPGDGFGSKSRCAEYCRPHPQATYRCNTTSYTCDECKPGDTGCSPDRAAECTTCHDPNPNNHMFKCDKTDPDHPQCKQCEKNKTEGCQPKGQACSSCAPKPDLYECDPKELKCKKANHTGNIKQACDASCGHITPQELLGTWRGLMAKEGQANMFDMGEIDLIFGDKNLTVKYPNRTQDIYDVSTTGGDNLILQKGNETIKVVHNILAYLKHTTAAGLTTFGPGKEAPDSFKAGMSSDDALSLTMWRCNQWGGQGTCDFTNKTESSPPPAPVEAVAPNAHDPCNDNGDCHTCIAASSGDVRCGWCLGGTLSYAGVGNTPYKCGGFAKDQPFNFTCPADFRTTDCKGYSCDWETKKCNLTNDGQFPDEQSCSDACSHQVTHAKCNTGTKQCEACKEGDKGCNTAAFCAATCGKPHAYCDYATGQCVACQQGDKNCTQTKETCDQECSKETLKKCDHKTGKCSVCEKGGDGCVPGPACDNTCSIGPDPNQPYMCNWNTPTGKPECKQDDSGTMNKTQCTQTCEEPSFGKCEFSNNTCVKCNHTGDSTCIQTMDYCKIAQKEGRCKTQDLKGLFRMIEAEPGYAQGEFDILFKDGKMYMQDYVTKVDAKDLGDVKATGAAEGGGVTFEVTNWKPEPKIWPHDKLFGVYKKSYGESNTFTFLELAFAEEAITKLDQGLKGRYFVGASCADTKICDFSKATPAEMQQSSLYAKYKFFLG